MRRQSWKRDRERRESRKSFRDSGSLHHCIAREDRVVSNLDVSSFKGRRRRRAQMKQCNSRPCGGQDDIVDIHPFVRRSGQLDKMCPTIERIRIDNLLVVHRRVGGGGESGSMERNDVVDLDRKAAL